jgi:hypothetical protein
MYYDSYRRKNITINLNHPKQDHGRCYIRGNGVTVKHVAEHVIETFHVDEFSGFTETPEDAFNTAVLDCDQYILKCIHSYQGNPDKRTTIFFYTEWEDVTILWKPWNDDITNTQQFQLFCEKRKELMFLLI